MVAKPSARTNEPMDAPSHPVDHEGVPPLPRPRPRPRAWQENALEQWVAAGRRGIASVVTGAGKTLFAEFCMADAAQAIPDVRFVVVVPTHALLDQWFVSLQEDLGISGSDIQTYSGESIPSSPGLVNLLVLNTARRWAPELAQRLGKTFLIVDECHRAGSPENGRALAGGHTATLGLSATPEREHDDAFQEVIVPALGPVVYEYGYSDARADGVIVPFDLVNIRIPLTEKEQHEYDVLSRRVARLMAERIENEEQLKRVLLRRASISSGAALRIPTAIKLARQHSDARTLIFHEQIAAAERIRGELQRLGLSVTIYHSRLGDAIRRDNLRLFRRGVFDYLVSCRALDEGVNVPETSVAIVASSTGSTRQRIQRLGRVLRPAPGKTTALIFTIYATDVEEHRLLDEASADSGASSVKWQRMSVPEHA
jgi:superfamily II DNA or RNA helicase